MTSLKPVAALLAMTCAGMPALSFAADDVASLRAEIQALKNEHAERIAALEARIDQLEILPAATPAPLPERPRSNPTAFNPAISMVLAGTFTNTSQDPESWRIAGFMPNDGEIGPGERSFSLGESELTLAASVDPYFAAQLTAAVAGEDEIAVEEAFFRTLALPSGFSLKGGRFFSQLGYVNEQHAHVWDFVDQPLVYQALFGGQYAQDGVQVKWLAPTDLFVELGAEAGNGGAFPGTRRNRNGLNGATAFAHVGGDVGDSTSWRAGVSWLEVRAQDRVFEDEDDAGNAVVNAFTGKSRTWIVDATLKWTPFGNTTGRQLELQGEYLRRKETGELIFDTEGLALADSFRSEPSGWYAQSVYTFRPRWRAGLRYDALDSGSPELTFPSSVLRDATADRMSLMLDWSPTEFSRLRAQYAWDDARDAGDRDRQFLLQYLFGIGAHGAHKF